MRELTKYTYQAASSESRAGAESDANEVGANAGESLYSPSDLAKGKIKIVGDPAWIQQGSVAAGVNVSGFDTNGFLPDGTINFDSSQVMFAIEWQKPQDYNLKTGLADPYGKNNKERKPINSYVYQALKCVSEFRQGRFEQTIDGSLYYYPTENLKNTATTPSNAVADQTNGRPTDPASDPNTNTGAGTTQAPAGIDNTRLHQPVTVKTLVLTICRPLTSWMPILSLKVKLLRLILTSWMPILSLKASLHLRLIQPVLPYHLTSKLKETSNVRKYTTQ